MSGKTEEDSSKAKQMQGLGPLVSILMQQEKIQDRQDSFSYSAFGPKANVKNLSL